MKLRDLLPMATKKSFLRTVLKVKKVRVRNNPFGQGHVIFVCARLVMCHMVKKVWERNTPFFLGHVMCHVTCRTTRSSFETTCLRQQV